MSSKLLFNIWPKSLTYNVEFYYKNNFQIGSGDLEIIPYNLTKFTSIILIYIEKNNSKNEKVQSKKLTAPNNNFLSLQKPRPLRSRLESLIIKSTDTVTVKC